MKKIITLTTLIGLAATITGSASVASHPYGAFEKCTHDSAPARTPDRRTVVPQPI